LALPLSQTFNPQDLGSLWSSVFLLALGMAGSRKNTFVQKLTGHLHCQGFQPYVINLDPAVHEVPFPANTNIHDTVKYKEVKKQCDLGAPHL
uniref:GPN-loop GTPase n=1 Tax=Spermophilus dauricus TaxID=99837 RepID=A0A8C9UWY2_SPEDA